MPVQTELQLLSTYLTGRLNQLIAIVNTKGTTAQALTAIRNGVPLAGDDLLKLYNLAVGLQTNINTINGLLLSDDTTLDELQEVVDFIKANRDDLDNLSIANIAGLQDALDAKLSLAGGIMSGNIVTDYFIASFNNLNLRSGWGTVSLHNEANPGIPLNLVYNLLSASRSVNFQDKDITVAGLDDIATAIAALVDSSPATLDTLNELATALGNDPSFATTVTNSIAAKLSLSGGTMTGNIELNGNSVKNNTGAVLLESSAGLFNLRSLLSTFIGVLNVSLLTANRTITFQDKDYTVAGLNDLEKVLQFAASDTSTTIAVGVSPIVVYAPQSMTINEVIVTLGTPQATGSTFTVDILKNGVTILSTLATIDNTEYTTLTATIPLVVSVTSLVKGDRITTQVTQIGGGSAAQLGVIIKGV